MSKITDDGLIRSGTEHIDVPVWQQWASKGAIECN